MKLRALIARLESILSDFGDCDIVSRSASEGGEILSVEVFTDTHECSVRGCSHQHESSPRANIVIDADWTDF